MAVAKIEYKKEFFDRDYTFREAYGRVWKYARKYRLRLAVGVICGRATAGTLVPFFQIVQRRNAYRLCINSAIYVHTVSKRAPSRPVHLISPCGVIKVQQR